MPEFREWLSSTFNFRVLCGVGGPGNGKTFIMSRIIDVLSALRKADKKMGVAHIYCDYKNSEQTAEKLVAAIVKQLLLSLSNIPKPAITAYKNYRKHDSALDYIPLPKVSQLLHLSFEAFDRVYICIDAIDELIGEEAKRLLETLKGSGSSCSIRLCITCRNLDSSPFRDILSPAEVYQVEIKANEKDIRGLIRHYIHSQPQEESDMVDEGLENHITKRVIALSSGNFLLATSQIKIVLSYDTKSMRRECLETLPTTIADVFRAEVENIRHQVEYRGRYGILLLTWVHLAERPLSVDELLHILATAKEDTDIDPQNFVPRLALADYCLGLVVIDKQTSTARLVHKVPADYLDTQDIMDGHNMIAETCLKYLRLRTVIGNSKSVADNSVEPRNASESLALIEYAACEWGNHARKSGERESLVKLVEEYFCMDPLERYLGLWHLYNRIHGDDILQRRKHSAPLSLSMLHVAAYFGLNWIFLSPQAIDLDWDAKDDEGRSSLSLAAASGHDGTMFLLIDKGAEVDSVDCNKLRPLFHALRNQRTAAAELLIENGADLNAKDYIGAALLHWVAEKDDGPMMMLLLNHLADMESKEDAGATPLSWAIEHGSQSCLEILIGRGAETEFTYRPTHYALRNDNTLILGVYDGDTGDGHGVTQPNPTLDGLMQQIPPTTPLVRAAQTDNGAAVRMLLENGANANLTDAIGRTPLLAAAQRGFSSTIDILCEHAADLESKDHKYKRTGLAWAACNAHPNVVKQLLDKGAKADSEDRMGWTPLFCAVESGDETVTNLLLSRDDVGEMTTAGAGFTLLTLAAMTNRSKSMALLLARGDVDPNSKDDYGRTPLSWAVERDSLDAIALLLATDRVKADTAGTDGMTELSNAAYQGKQDVLEILISHGVDPASRDSYGRTPVWCAATGGHEAVVNLLISKYNTDPNSEDDFGRTPLLMAVRNDHLKVVETLLDHCQNRDIAICSTDLSCEAAGMKNSPGGRVSCDVCMVNVPNADLHYHCGVCNSGNFDICLECVSLGAQCLDSSHQLVERSYTRLLLHCGDSSDAGR